MQGREEINGQLGGREGIKGGGPILVAFALRIHNFASKSKKIGSLKISKRE